VVSDKDVLQHKNWNQQLREDLKVFEHLGGKAMYERHSFKQNLAVSFVKLCQVGIEHRHKVQLEELCCEFRQKP
jgi:hypothetical protein